MEIKIIYFITLLLYAAVISQSFFYLLAMSSVTYSLKAEAFIEVRQLLDKNLKTTLGTVYYAALLSSVLLVAFSVTNPHGLLFFSAALSLIALVVDIIITIRGNIPLNRLINSWSPKSYPENWGEYRSRWLATYRIRQVLHFAGFVSLVAGYVFS